MALRELINNDEASFSEPRHNNPFLKTTSGTNRQNRN
jgi:hypothetical protein